MLIINWITPLILKVESGKLLSYRKKTWKLSRPILRDYFGLIFDELFTVFDSRGKFSRLNVFFISTVKKLLQEVYCYFDE
jgi:hypothetical protein